MRTTYRRLLAMAVPVALPLFQACNAGAPTAPSRGELAPAAAKPHMFHALLDEVVMDDPNAEEPRLNGGLVRLNITFQEENERGWSITVMEPNPDGVQFLDELAIIGPGDDIIFDLDGCRSCPIVVLGGSAIVSLDQTTTFFQDPEDFIARLAFDGENPGMVSGHFGPPIPEEAQ